VFIFDNRFRVFVGGEFGGRVGGVGGFVQVEVLLA